MISIMRFFFGQHVCIWCKIKTCCTKHVFECTGTLFSWMGLGCGLVWLYWIIYYLLTTYLVIDWHSFLIQSLPLLRQSLKLDFQHCKLLIYALQFNSVTNISFVHLFCNSWILSASGLCVLYSWRNNETGDGVSLQGRII